MSNAKKQLKALIALYKKDQFDELHKAWGDLEASESVKVLQESETLDLEDFLENCGGVVTTWHTLYFNEEKAHTWRMDWRGNFKLNSLGLREWSDLCNEYSEDYGYEFGFTQNGEMYDFLDTIGIYDLYEEPDVPELPSTNTPPLLSK
jgi:hypothetical protein